MPDHHRPPFARRVAPRVKERHARACALSRGRRRCTCDPSYRARVAVGGRHASAREATFSTLAEAVAWAEQTQAMLRAGRVPAMRTAAPGFGDAAISFLHRARDGVALTRSRRPYAPATISGYETMLRRHVLSLTDPRAGVALADLPADVLDARTLQAAVDELTVRESPEVARLAAAAVGAVLRDLYARGLTDAPPPRVSLPPPAPPRERFLTTTEADRLLQAAEADDAVTGRSLMAPLVALLVATGARISEALALTWGPLGLDLDGDPPRARITRATTKTNAGARAIPLERAYVAVLRRHRLASGRPAGGALVFADDDGKPLGRGGRVRSGLRRVFRAAGVEGFGPHVLRHSQGTWLGSAGVPAAALAARLGHTDPAFTMRRYVKPSPADLAAAPDALAALRERERASARGYGEPKAATAETS